MKFLLVSLFETEKWNVNSFYLNLEHINKIVLYDPEIYAPIKIDSKTGKEIRIIPEGALDSIFVRSADGTYHLDTKSSKKVLDAIKSIKKEKK